MYQEPVVSSTADEERLDGADDEVYFEDFDRQLADNAVSHVVTSEDFLIEFIQSKMDLRMYDCVIQILKQIDFVASPKFLQFWDEAHYKKREEDGNAELTALQKYRIRKRNTPPRGICGGGERPNFRMSKEARALLEEWFRGHVKDPYPSRKTKNALSQQAGITLNQINTWFANARRKRRKQIKQSCGNGTKFVCQSSKVHIVTTGVDTSFLQRPTSSFNKPITIHNSYQRPCFIHSSLKENETTVVSGCDCWGSFNKPATISTPIGSTECRKRSLKEIQLSNLQQCEHMRYPNKMRDRKLRQNHSPALCFTSATKTVLENGKPATALSNSVSQPSVPNSIFFNRQQKSVVLQRLRGKLKQERLETSMKCNGDCAIAKDSLNSLRDLCDKLETTVVSPIDFAKTVSIDDFDCKNDVEIYSWMEDFGQWESKAFIDDYGFTQESSPWTQSARATNSRFSDQAQRANIHRSLYTKCASELTPRQTTEHLLFQEGYSFCQPRSWNVMTDISQPLAATHTMLSMFDDQNEDPVDLSKIDTSHLEESYGTIVGEAIQGLLNLSSQESDSSL